MRRRPTASHGRPVDARGPEAAERPKKPWSPGGKPPFKKKPGGKPFKGKRPN
ncbi:MAG: hypothetical protein WDN45_02685 [Caulobacteraceae bacterium]